MVKEIKFFCDICDKEFPPQEYAFINGQTIKVDRELKVHPMAFEGHYCGKCSEEIIKYIESLKYAKDSGATTVDKSVEQRRSNC